jgi:hypothetical protein
VYDTPAAMSAGYGPASEGGSQSDQQSNEPSGQQQHHGGLGSGLDASTQGAYTGGPPYLFGYPPDPSYVLQGPGAAPTPTGMTTSPYTSTVSGAGQQVPSAVEVTRRNTASKREHRKRRSIRASITAIDNETIVLAMYKQGKSWQEIANAIKVESAEIAYARYGSLVDVSQTIEWDDQDVEALRDLLEPGERAKWKFVSSELSRERNKRITAVACQKKFKDMFGVAEASSILGSSLSYVVSPNGWDSLNSLPPPRAGSFSIPRHSAAPSVDMLSTSTIDE